MLTRAFVLSVILHFAILLGAEAMVFPSSSDGVTRRTTLIASLGKPAIATSAPAQPPTSNLRSQPSVQPKRSNLLTRAPPAAPVVSPSAMSAVRESLPAVGKSALFVAPSKEGAKPDPTPVELAETVSAEGLRQYRLNLAREAQRFRQYPAYARERGWEGEVVVILSALPGGDGPVLSLGKGSGHEPLDRQALEMMKNAASRAAMPDVLSGKHFRIFVPVQFRLDD